MAAELPETEHWIRSSDGTRLFCRGWSVPDSRIALAVIHGLGDHSGRYRALARSLAVESISTFAVDLRGSGRSPGQRGFVSSWSRWEEDASALIRSVPEWFEGEVVPLGHSFGATVLLAAIVSGRIEPGRFVVSSPCLRLRLQPPAWKTRIAPWMSRLAPRVALYNEVVAADLSHDPAVVGTYRTDPLVHDRLAARTYMAWFEACARILANASAISAPFLVIHGADDPIVDPAGSRALAHAAGERAELRIYEGRLHECFNDFGREEVTVDLARWLRESAGRAASA